MKETKNLETLVSEMEALCDYFKRNIKNNSLFTPEYTVSAAINKRFKSAKPMTIDTARAMLRLIRKLKPDNHYDGTGWGDYKWHLYCVFRLLKFKRITKNAMWFDWQTEPFPATFTEIPFNRTFSAGEMEKIKAGFVPEQMEDKWFMYFEDGILHCHRSWTGHYIYQLIFSDENTCTRMMVNRDRTQYNYADDKQDIDVMTSLIKRLLKK